MSSQSPAALRRLAFPREKKSKSSSYFRVLRCTWISRFASLWSPRFGFMGLSNLMEQLLIAGARHLRLPTPFGIKKIMRNILALQQSIKALPNDQKNTELDRAKRYYSLFNVSPQVSCSSSPALVC